MLKFALSRFSDTDEDDIEDDVDLLIDSIINGDESS